MFTQLCLFSLAVTPVSKMAGNFIIEAWTELAIAMLTIILRLYFSIAQRGWKAMTVDDYLMVLAGVSASASKEDIYP